MSSGSGAPVKVRQCSPRANEIRRGDVEVVGVEGVAGEETERYVVINCVVDRLGGGGRRGGEGSVVDGGDGFGCE